MTPDSILERNITFPYSAVNCLHFPKPTAVLNLFQDMASEHAAHLNVSGLDLAAHDYLWVISRYHIHMRRPIRWMDPVCIATWRTPYKNLYEIREFRITDPDKNALVDALGVWVMVSKTTGKPVRLSRFLPDHMQICPPGFECEMTDIVPPESPDMTRHFAVAAQDLDLNQHANNTAYLFWAMEAVPRSFYLSHMPVTIDIAFHHPTFLGRNIVSESKIADTGNAGPVSRHIITETESGTRLCTVNILWHPIKT